MAQIIIPLRDLKNTTAISEKCKQVNEPIFVTKNGYGDMVVMSLDVYTRTMAQLDLYRKLKASDEEILSGGKTVEAGKFMGDLRRRHEGLLR